MARETKKTGGGFRWRLVLALAAISAAGASTAWAGFRLHRYAVTDPRFRLTRDHPDSLTIRGLAYASRWRVERVFSADFDRSVFSIPLEERRRRLLGIDWIEDATVSRVWPDRLMVQIRERQPVAFVSFASGVLLIDPHGVLLEPPPGPGLRSPCSVAFGRPRVKPSAASVWPPCCGWSTTWGICSGMYPK